MSEQAARPYAQALFDLAAESQSTAEVDSDMVGLGKLVSDSPEFADFIQTPLISRDRKDEALAALLGSKVSPLTLRFLRFLNSKRRLEVLAPVAVVFHRMVMDEQGILESDIISAQPLSTEQVEKISTRLKARFGKEIQTRVHVDPNLIGGFKIHVGDTVYDHSIKNQLEAIRQNIIKA